MLGLVVLRLPLRGSPTGTNTREHTSEQMDRSEQLNFDPHSADGRAILDELIALVDHIDGRDPAALVVVMRDGRRSVWWPTLGRWSDFDMPMWATNAGGPRDFVSWLRSAA